MSTEQTDLRTWLEERETIHEAATEGEWESGYWYHVQGESHCTCREDQGPLVGIDPHGTFGRMHVHRRPEPIWEEGIRTRDDSTGGCDVVVDTDEYGGTTAEDRAAIVDAHNTLPKLLAGVRAVLELHKPVPRRGVYGPSRGTEWVECEGCTKLVNEKSEWDHEDTSVDYPCPTVQKLQEAINDD